MAATMAHELRSIKIDGVTHHARLLAVAEHGDMDEYQTRVKWATLDVQVESRLPLMTGREITVETPFEGGLLSIRGRVYLQEGGLDYTRLLIEGAPLLFPLVRDDAEASMLRAIAAEPHEDAHRLIYADWLEEHGETKKALILRQISGSAMSPLATRVYRTNVVCSGVDDVWFDFVSRRT
jgi:uncharacterized protein (TIGR02996 family)